LPVNGAQSALLTESERGIQGCFPLRIAGLPILVGPDAPRPCRYRASVGGSVGPVFPQVASTNRAVESPRKGRSSGAAWPAIERAGALGSFINQRATGSRPARPVAVEANAHCTDFAGWQISTMGPQCPTKFAGANRLR